MSEEEGKRFWMHSDVEGVAPFGEATMAVVDEVRGGVVAYFGDFGMANDYVNRQNEEHISSLAGRRTPPSAIETLKLKTASYIKEMTGVADDASTSPLMKQRLLAYAAALKEWTLCYDGACEDTREAENRIRRLGGTTLDGVSHSK